MISKATKILNTLRWHKILAILTICLATLLVFDGVLKGKQINNSAYLYAFEPWIYYFTPETGNYNFILSDDMDAMSISYPTRDLLAKGEFSFWNRFWQLGIPEFRIDSGWFYPLRIFWVLFGIPIGMTLEVLLRFAAGGVFTFLLLELIGVRRIVALVSALGYAFGSNSIGDYMYGFGPPGLSLPIVFYFVERVIKFKRSREILFLSLSLILLNTHIMVHVNALISIWIGIYVSLRIASERFSAAVFRRLSLALIFAPLLYAIALVPTLDFYLNYFNDSYRQEYSASQLNSGALLSIFYNKFFGDPLTEPNRYIFGTFVNTGIFIGFLVGAFGLLLSILRLVFQRDKYVVILSCMTITLLTTIFDLKYESTEKVLGMFPLLRSIRPFYQKPLLQFLFMLLGALGLDYFLKLTKKNLLQIGFAIIAMISLQIFGAYAFIYYYNKNGPSPISWRYFEIYTTVHVLLFMGLLWLNPIFHAWLSPKLKKISIAIVSFGLIGLTTLESRNATRTWIPYTSRSSFYPATETTNFLLQNLKHSRVVTLDLAAVPGLLFGYSIPVAAGRSLPRQPYLELLRLVHPEFHKDHPTQSFFPSETTDLGNQIWKLIDINYFVAGKNIDPKFIQNKYDDRILVHPFKDGSVLERRDKSKGYVATYKIVQSENFQDAKKLLESGFNIDHGIIAYKEDLPEVASPPCNSHDLKVSNFKVKNDRVIAKLRNQCPAYFMPSMFYDKGWSAYVDGVEVPIYLGYGFMPLIKIETPGTHQIEFKYLPRGVIYGGLISGVSLIIFITILYIRKRAQRDLL